MIRAFVGIALPEEIERALASVQAGLPVGRPVEPENLHLTLAFLGEQPEPVLEDLHHGLAAIDAPAFSLAIDGLDMFGGARPRTLHAVVTPNGALSRLRAKVHAVARTAGIEMPRERFVPHVTLARYNRPPAGEDLALLRAFVERRLALRTPPFEVEEFVLYRSILRQAGAIYEPLAVYPLG
jgi:2'-5' RNA ligase